VVFSRKDKKPASAEIDDDAESLSCKLKRSFIKEFISTLFTLQSVFSWIISGFFKKIRLSDYINYRRILKSNLGITILKVCKFISIVYRKAHYLEIEKYMYNFWRLGSDRNLVIMVCLSHTLNNRECLVEYLSALFFPTKLLAFEVFQVFEYLSTGIKASCWCLTKGCLQWVLTNCIEWKQRDISSYEWCYDRNLGIMDVWWCIEVHSSFPLIA